MARLRDMTIPTQAQLLEEVERVFRDRFPAAPQHLNPDDPDQADLVAAWLEIRDETVNRWTDDVFYQLFPAGPGRLDPNDPTHADQIEYWLDIRDQIRDDAAPKFDYSPPPVLVSVAYDPGDLGALVLQFDGPIEVDAAIPYLWHDGLPAGVELQPFGRTSLRLRGLTNQTFLTMEPEAAELIRQADLVPMEA